MYSVSCSGVISCTTTSNRLSSGWSLNEATSFEELFDDDVGWMVDWAVDVIPGLFERGCGVDGSEFIDEFLVKDRYDSVGDTLEWKEGLHEVVIFVRDLPTDIMLLRGFLWIGVLYRHETCYRRTRLPSGRERNSTF